MTKLEMINALEEKGINNATEAYDVMIDVMTETFKKGGEVTLKGIGVLKVKNVDARTARNPKTGESIKVPAKKAINFKASTTIKKLLND